MKAFLSILNLSFLPKSADLALLLLRGALGAGMIHLHGWNKWTDFSRLSGKFADPLHLGSSKVSLGLIVFAEVVCSALLIVGFCSRFAALVLSIGMGVAFFLYHKASLSAGETAALYLLGYLVVLCAGPGKFSFDGSGSGGADAGGKG